MGKVLAIRSEVAVNAFMWVISRVIRIIAIRHGLVIQNLQAYIRPRPASMASRSGRSGSGVVSIGREGRREAQQFTSGLRSQSKFRV
jgi:hypothetical protein